jgi:hypothetical protein
MVVGPHQAESRVNALLQSDAASRCSLTDQGEGAIECRREIPPGDS